MGIFSKKRLHKHMPLGVVVLVTTFVVTGMTFTLLAATANTNVDFGKATPIATLPFSGSISTYGAASVNDSATQRSSLASIGLGVYRIPLQWNGGNIVSSAANHPAGSGDDWVKNIKAVGGQPMIAIGGSSDNNFSPADAANLVKHFNQGGNRVDKWIVGNNPSLGNMSIQAYCTLFNSSVDAMKAVDPTIKVAGPAWAYFDEGALRDFLGCAGTKVDIIDYHHFGMGETYLSDADALAQTKQYEDQVVTAKKLIAAVAPNRASQIEVQVSEYNWAWRANDGYPGWQGDDRFYKSISTVWAASVAGHIAKAGGRGHQSADQNGALGLTFSKNDAATQYGKKLADPMPAYHGLRMFSGGNLFRGFGGGIADATTNLANAEVYASTNKNIVVINKSPDLSQLMTAHLSGFIGGTADVWQTDKNAPFDAPKRKAILTIGDTLSYSLPPYSVTTFVLNEKAGVTATTTTTAPAPAPTQNSAPTVTPIRYGRYFFDIDNKNSCQTQATRWPTSIAQGNHVSQAKCIKAVDPSHVSQIVYSEPVAWRSGDPDGYTTAVLPKLVESHTDWLLLDSSGRRIHRDANDDYELDVGNVAYQQASVDFLLNKISKEGWDGAFLDDVNPTPLYAFPSARPAKYPTDASWQVAQKAYVSYVCSGLRRAGKLCYINIGSQDDWGKSTSALSDGAMHEFFVANDRRVGDGPQKATIESGWWQSNFNWALWAEANTAHSFYHASTTDKDHIDFALGTFLLATQGNGIFGASNDYGDNSDADNYTTAMADALKLGAASGNYVADGSGIYYRNFANGKVVVNPHDNTRTYAGLTLAAATAKVLLNNPSVATVPAPAPTATLPTTPTIEPAPTPVATPTPVPTTPAPTTPVSTGLQGTYFVNQDLTGQSFTRTDKDINFDWGVGSPMPGIPVDHFSARWTGQITVPTSDTYTFSLTGDDGVRLWIDDKLVIDGWRDQDSRNYQASTTLTAGKAYNLRLEYYENWGDAVVKLSWKTPSGTSGSIGTSAPSQPAPSLTPIASPGLALTYYRYDGNGNLTTQLYSTTSPNIDYDWMQAAPNAYVPADRWGATWQGNVTVPTTGTYTFTTHSDDGIRVWVNGQQIIDAWNDHSIRHDSGNITLEGGKTYSIKVSYYENYIDAAAKLHWNLPGQQPVIIPPSAFTHN